MLALLYLFLGAVMMYLLQPSKQSEAISIATSLDQNLTECTIEVIFIVLFLCCKAFWPFPNRHRKACIDCLVGQCDRAYQHV